MVKVSVKWGKKKFDDIELNLEEPPSVFKAQLFALSGVLPEKQKIMIKGGTLKDDTDWKTLGIKDGHVFMMMGTAESDIPTQPVEKTTFIEDLSQDQVGLYRAHNYPPGLTNLGNTCYMNSTIQCMKAVPELHKVLKSYSGSVREEDLAHNLTVSMRDLLNVLDNSTEPVPPFMFLQHLRTGFPQFAQKNSNGTWMQQDAEECWSQVMLTIASKLPRLQSKNAETKPDEKVDAVMKNAVAQLFAGAVFSVTQNAENPEEPAATSVEAVYKFPCHISGTTNYLLEGLKEGMQEEIHKNSPSLNKECKYLKTSRVVKLPYYLTVQFVRFLWKKDKQVKAKIVRPVEFPLWLDIYDLCSDELKSQLLPQRKLFQDFEEKRIQEETKKAKESKLDQKKEEPTKKSDKLQFNWDDISTDPSELVNETGLYELVAVLTHKGRTADSGHYIGWVKQAENSWLKFDDDVVSEVNDEEIKKLSGKGGGDWHIAYICLYRSRRLPKEQQTQNNSNNNSDKMEM